MDEILKAILEAANAAQKNQGSKPGNSSMNYDEVAAMKKEVTTTAKFAKMQYDQFIAVGFTEEQSIQLLVSILN